MVPPALAFAQTGGPPALDPAAQAGLQIAVQAAPAAVGIAMANWNGKVVCQFIEARCGIRLCRRACTRYRHRLGFVDKRPQKRLRKADAAKRAAFVEEYAVLRVEARILGAKIFFVDEAHFRADADLHGKWVLEGRPALVDSTCPRWGEQAGYYSAVCLGTGETEYRELTGTRSSATSAAFLPQVRAHQPQPLIVGRDNGPAHSGDAVRAYLATADNAPRVVRLPAYRPDCNADEAIRGWAREAVTANTCLGTTANVPGKMAHCLDGLKDRADEVQSRCRTKVPAVVEAVDSLESASPTGDTHVGFVCASV